MRLAKHKKTGEYYALKILKKAEIIRLKQVDHIISEFGILGQNDHPFLVWISFFLLNYCLKIFRLLNFSKLVLIELKKNIIKSDILFFLS